jgi:hypothetical protein
MRRGRLGSTVSDGGAGLGELHVRRIRRTQMPGKVDRLSRKGSAMKKFLVLYKASQAAFAQMMKVTPEQQKAGMDAWMARGKKAQAAIVDMGAPLGKALRVTPGGAAPTANDLGGYSILQAESKEALAETLKGHPHFMMPDSSIEIVELMPVPGTN